MNYSCIIIVLQTIRFMPGEMEKMDVLVPTSRTKAKVLTISQQQCLDQSLVPSMMSLTCQQVTGTL